MKHKPDDVIQELWAVKDAAAQRFASIGEYSAYLIALQKKECSKKVNSGNRSNAPEGAEASVNIARVAAPAARKHKLR